MVIYRMLSRLLDYPDQDLLNHLVDLQSLVAGDTAFVEAERAVLQDFLNWMHGKTLTELQADYVNTFDMNADHSLHLTHHTLGEDRGRGPALIELDEHYRTNGLGINEKRELPDYLPVILEYVSTLDAQQAQWFLGQMKRVLALLSENLEKDAVPYASLVRLVETRAQILPQNSYSETS